MFHILRKNTFSNHGNTSWIQFRPARMSWMGLRVIHSQLSRSWQLGGLVPVFSLGVPLRCKASKLRNPLRIPPLGKEKNTCLTVVKQMCSYLTTGTINERKVHKVSIYLHSKLTPNFWEAILWHKTGSKQFMKSTHCLESTILPTTFSNWNVFMFI